MGKVIQIILIMLFLFNVIFFIQCTQNITDSQENIIKHQVYGKLLTSEKTFKRIEAVVSSDSTYISELWYNTATFGFTGFAYFVENTNSTSYSVYVKVFNRDSLFTGRSPTVTFNDLAGDIEIPSFNPYNAVPIPNAGADFSISVNDSMLLYGSAIDSFGGNIVKWEWDAGNTGVFTETTPDSSFVAIAPSTVDTAYPCVLKVTDNDGNIAVDTVIVNVLTDIPIPTASTITPIVSINDTIRLQGTAADVYGRIVKWEWDAGNTGTFAETTPDSSFATIAPSSQNVNYQCVLKVTDDDANVAKDTVYIGVFSGQVIDIDGNVYRTVVIGNQEWTVENLRTTRYNDGTPIPKITSNSEWENNTSGAYCYYGNDSAANAAKYGALYNWYAVNTSKLAPAGWHVPTDADWDTLQNYLIANGYNWDSTTTGNKIGKSMAAKTDWQSSDVEGHVGNDLSSNNSSLFSALPGGYRNHVGTFNNQGNHGHWWSSSELSASYAYLRNLCYYNGNLGRYDSSKEYGFSVRLLRDN